MTEKMKAYLDGLFASIPATDEVREAREELYDGMVERYKDCLREGMDEQEAYDTVIDSIGDIRELFDELNQDAPAPKAAAPKAPQAAQTQQAPPVYRQNTAQTQTGPEAQTQPQQPPNSEQASNQQDGAGPYSGEGQTGYTGQQAQNGFSLSDLVEGITDFTSGLVSGFLGGNDHTDLPLVNSVSIPLVEISHIDVSYIAESIRLRYSADDHLVINEYMNRGDDPSLLADIKVGNGSVLVHNGRRTGIFWLRSHIEVLLPVSWYGSLALSTVSGNIKGDDEWRLSSFAAKTVSGSVKLNSITAAIVRLASTSGSVQLQRGVGTMEMSSISGSIKMESVEGGGSFRTTSGSVRVQFDALTGHVDASSVSGGVRLGLPPDASFELDAKSVSGGIHTAFDELLNFQKRNRAHGFVGTAPHYQIRAKTTSGGIHIND